MSSGGKYPARDAAETVLALVVGPIVLAIKWFWTRVLRRKWIDD